MTIPPFKAKVGIGGGFGSGPLSSHANFTSSVRQQMQGIINNFNGFCDYMAGVSPQILLGALQPTFEKSQVRVPYDTGDLHNSGYLEARQYPGGTQVEIGYGEGGEPHYAVFVHENLEVHHESPTSAKYLQGPLEEDEQQIQQLIVDGYKSASGT